MRLKDAKPGVTQPAKLAKNSFALDGSGSSKTTTFKISGTPKSYRLLKIGSLGKGILEISLGSGLQAYSFTFG